jgi:hypothetical protein
VGRGAIVLPNVVIWLFADRITGGAGEAAGAVLLLSIFGGLFVVAPLTAGMILRLMMLQSDARDACPRESKWSASSSHASPPTNGRSDDRGSALGPNPPG